MFCSKCGTQFQENDVICNNCGSGKKAVAQKKSNVKPHVVNAQAAPTQPNNSNGLPVGARILMILLGSALLFGGLSFGGIWCIGETLGFTANCITPFCNNSSTLFDDLCSRCRGVVDDVRGIFR